MTDPQRAYPKQAQISLLSVIILPPPKCVAGYGGSDMERAEEQTPWQACSSVNL